MAKLDKSYFDGQEVLFIGYSSRNGQFSDMVYRAFTKGGIKVYPMNNRQDASFKIKVYKDFSELPKIPSCAYILLNKENTAKVVKSLKELGIKKVMFQNKKSVDASTIEECKKMGMETAIACPMMVFGGGLHKLHGLLGGIKR